MIDTKQLSTEHDVARFVDHLIMTKRINYQQYKELSRIVLADGIVDEQERQQINRLFDAIRSNRVRVVD